jgi:Oxidoreductase family, NAD-binding Rossmann fold
VFDSIEAMAMPGEIHALWILTPNDTRLNIMREIHRLTKAGAPLRAIACEQPLASTLHEAREMLTLVEDAGLLHGYSMEFASLSTGLKVFLSRAVSGPEGEDLVEKQNAEHLMPVIEDEAGIHGYMDENRHMVEAFRSGENPFPSILQVLTIIRPETLIRWHRSGFRYYWRWKSRSLGGRPQIEAGLRALIRQMSMENPLWRATHPRRTSQTWV